MDTSFFLYDQGSINYQKLSDQKTLCPISNASMYNIAKNTKSAWTWTQVFLLYDQGLIHYQK
jgi:hypothetical protein